VPDNTVEARHWLEEIRKLEVEGPVRIMNVCGGHERSISMAGLRVALPDNIELIPGPGCPVCICPEEDVHEAIQIAMNEEVILLAYGDMLRVPVNAPRREPRSLEQARTAGADIRPIASPMEAIEIAQQNVGQDIVFFSAGFETTTAPLAAMLLEGVPDNLTILLSGRLTWPAVAMLLDSETPGFDCLVAPGHVATIMGLNEWQFVIDDHQLPTAVSGFTAESLLAAFYSVLRQRKENRLFLDNCYPEVVREEGNRQARKQMSLVFDIEDANWRGIGSIAESGFVFKSQFTHQDARERFPRYRDIARKRAGEMPPGCDCAKVVLGKKYPDQCKLYGRACTPRHPIGPCMVSDEGACRIWWASGIRESKEVA
jgi:hydrogenase expression/formation protein HypD